MYNAIKSDPSKFAGDLVKYIYGSCSGFLRSYPIDSISKTKMVTWAGYNSKQYIGNFISYLTKSGKAPLSYISGQSKVAIADTSLCNNYLTGLFSKYKADINRILDPNVYAETVLMPLRIHKRSNNSLTFSPDPESGEIVAFGELFGKNSKNNKIRPVVGYVIVNTPLGFKFNAKAGTKLYKAIEKYVDILIINNTTVITSYTGTPFSGGSVPKKICSVYPKSLTEEVSVASTYLNLSQIKAHWELCFIHTHHSSWQQMVVKSVYGKYNQHKIDRVSTKVDLIMQDSYPCLNSPQKTVFLVGEGKNDYFDLIRDKKIKKAMEDTSVLLDLLYECNVNLKFDAFIYNLNTVPDKDPSYYVNCEINKVEGAIRLGHFKSIAYEKNYVIIIVYLDEFKKTKFELVFSPNFNPVIRAKLLKEFK